MSESVLFQELYGVEQQSIAVLYTADSASVTPVEQQSIGVIYTADSVTAAPVEQQSIGVLYTADSATVAPVEQQSIAVLHSRQCHGSTSRTAIYRYTAQQTVPL